MVDLTRPVRLALAVGTFALLPALAVAQQHTTGKPASSKSAPTMAIVHGITRSVLPHGERIVIEFSDEVTYSGERVPSPDRVYLDFKGAAVSAGMVTKARAVGVGPVVTSIRMAQHSEQVTRVVIGLAGHPRYSVFQLYGPFRIVIDVETTGAPERPAAAPPSFVVSTPAPAAPAQTTHAPATAPSAATPAVATPATAPPSAAASSSSQPEPALPAAVPVSTAVTVAPAAAAAAPEFAAPPVVTAPAPPVPSSSAPVASATAPSATPPAPAPTVTADAGSSTAGRPTPPSGLERETAASSKAPLSKSIVMAAPPPAATNAKGDYSLARQLGLGVSRIVIDAGHGGHDPGAQSNGVTEAELVLDVALRLEKLLAQQPGVAVVLTRRTDEFIPLEERTAIANRECADLFLSIHANASRQPLAHGVETYFLNFATNPAAEAVAARENATSGKTMGNLPELVKTIALNNKVVESRELATIVQSSMIRRLRLQNKLVKDLGVKQAAFVVLIGAQMPSILAEISFVTNKGEAALLKQGAYRQRIAQALFDGVVKYQASLKKVTVADARRSD